MERLKGVGVSSGLAIGPALVAIQRTQVIRCPIGPERVHRELSALEAARSRSRSQLQQIRDRIAESKGRELAAIFDAQILLLDDPLLVGRAAEIVKEQRVNAEWAVQRALDELAAVFNGIADPYLRERKGDLHDVAGRLRMNMRGETGGPRDLLRSFDAPFVLVADELAPSVIAQLDWEQVRGFATDAGSRTHHTAILARSLGVPAVVGLGDVSTRVPPGAAVLIDGDTGDVTIDPEPALRREAEARVRLSRPRLSRAAASVEPAVTADDVRIVLEANIERSEDVEATLAMGAEGIGLYRSEFMLAGGPPEVVSEDEQYEEYRLVVQRMSPRPVTIRTFDIDERQHAAGLAGALEPSPWSSDAARPAHAGLRGIRFSLAHPDILRIQLRALLRAAAHGTLRVLFPFVSSVEEMRAARHVLADVRAELDAGGIRHGNVAVGAMIEVPSAAFTASLLGAEADFFTIGTNDLIQYTLAVDRTDERVAALYEPLHPAVLRLLRHIRRGAARHRIPVSLCGEMAADPVLLPLLIGSGLREFSMTSGALPEARRAVQGTNVGRMARVAGRVLALGTVVEIQQCLLEAYGHTGTFTTVHLE